MVCLTSCVFRSIRFSGFALPHFGVRREGELYTQAQAQGKGASARAQDGHKLGDNSCLRPPFPKKAGPGPQAPRPAPTGRASAPLDARTRGDQAASARGTPARGRRRCNVPSPIKDARFPTPHPSPKARTTGPPLQTTGLSRPGRLPHRAHRSAPPSHAPGVTPREEVAGNPKGSPQPHSRA